MALRLRALNIDLYLWGKSVGTIPDLIELGSPENTNVSIRPPSQIQLPTVSCAHKLCLSEEIGVFCIMHICSPEASRIL